MLENNGTQEPNNESNQPDTPLMTQNQAPTPQKPKKKPTFIFNVTYRVLRAIFVIMVIVIAAIGALGLGVGSGYFASLVKGMDVPKEEDLKQKIYDVEQQSRMLYSDESTIAVIKSDLIRTNVTAEEISPFIKQALVSTEDENFYEHPGVVPKAIARATISDVIGVGSSSGGSSITQQLIKQQVLTSETSYKRKASEILLALHTEKFLSKTEILNAYLNVSPFGRNNRGENIAGIEEAALGVFGVHAKDVSIPQAAFLAGLPQSPIDYTPYTNTGELKKDVKDGLARKDDVLFNMYRKKFIKKKEYEDALAYDLTKDFIAPDPSKNNNSGFLYDYVYAEATRVLMPQYFEKDGYTQEDIDQSDDLYDKYFEMTKRELRQDGYTVYSTIDKSIYNAMQQAVQEYGYLLDDGRNMLLETGSILMDNQTGRIYGFIGGRNYQQTQFNHAFQQRRSPGSTIKPILAYAPAIDVGLIGSESKLSDFPLKYKSGQVVKNYSDEGSNSFKTVRESLKWSLNIPVVNLYQELHQHTDPKTYFDKMNIGLNPDEYYIESIPLGGTDEGLTILEETEAFATLANRGQFNEGYAIDKIVNNSGDVVYQHELNPVEVYKPATASIMNDMMRDVIQSGTGQPAKDALNDVSPTLANADWVGKTGTSENEKDYWFTASTPKITMSSWIGYDDGTIMYQTWNKQNMIYWAYMTNYVFQTNPDIFGAYDKFTIDDSVIKGKVAEFTGEKPGVVTVDNYRYQLTGGKTVTSLYATEGPKPSEFRFGIGGSDADYTRAWQSYSQPKEKPKPKKEVKPKKKEKKEDD